MVETDGLRVTLTADSSAVDEAFARLAEELAAFQGVVGMTAAQAHRAGQTLKVLAGRFSSRLDQPGRLSAMHTAYRAKTHRRRH